MSSAPVLVSKIALIHSQDRGAVISLSVASHLTMRTIQEGAGGGTRRQAWARGRKQDREWE